METSKTSSTVVAVDSGEHLFRVSGHSKVTGANTCVTSETFRVGGHDWAILYYPNGDASIADGQFTSMFVKLVSAIESDVRAFFSLCLQDPAATGEKNQKSFHRKFLPSDQKTCGFHKFMSRDDLAASGCLQDDCLLIKCTVHISQLIDDDNTSINVPPSNLTTDLSDLLQRGLKADLTVKVGKQSQSFNVHRCLLRTRSPVFLAQLRESMEESKQSTICIEDMDAKVFEALLHYIYSDCLPGFMEETTEEATIMARDLLAAADRYRIQRLKVMCESRLSQSLDADTVCSTLDLAEQYKCEQLKDCCLNYMASDNERLRTIKKTKGFELLMKKHPIVVCDILSKVLDRKDATSTPP